MLRNCYFIPLVGLSLLAASCKEKLESCPGRCTILTGRLLTSGSQPLPDAAVTATWNNGRGLFSTSRTKARATTDTSGNYQVSFYAQDDELQDGYFYLTYEPDKSHYYVLLTTDGPDTGAGTLKRDTTYQLLPFLIPRKAAIKLTVPNPDQIQGYFSVSFGSAYGRSLSPSKISIGSGASIGIPKQNTPYTNTVEVAADQKLYVQISRSTNGGTYTHTTDSLVVPAGTTHHLTVTY